MRKFYETCYKRVTNVLQTCYRRVMACYGVFRNTFRRQASHSSLVTLDRYVMCALHSVVTSEVRSARCCSRGALCDLRTVRCACLALHAQACTRRLPHLFGSVKSSRGVELLGPEKND